MKKLVFMLLACNSISFGMQTDKKKVQESKKVEKYDSLFLFVKDQMTTKKQEQIMTILKQNINDSKLEIDSIVNIILPDKKDLKTAESLAVQIDILRRDLDCGNTAQVIANYFFKKNLNNPLQTKSEYTSLFTFVKDVLNNSPEQINQRKKLYQEILKAEENQLEAVLPEKQKLLVELALPDQDNQKIAQSLCTRPILEGEGNCAFITSAVGTHFSTIFIKKSETEIKEAQTKILKLKRNEAKENIEQAKKKELKRIWKLHLKSLEKDNKTYQN